MRHVSDKHCRENQDTHFMFNIVFLKSAVYKVKYGTARQVTDDNNMRPRKDAIFMPDNEGKNTDTLRIRKTYCLTAVRNTL